jgi:hypothetical protein
MKLDTHYIYTLQEDIYNSNHQSITSIRHITQTHVLFERFSCIEPSWELNVEFMKYNG